MERTPDYLTAPGAGRRKPAERIVFPAKKELEENGPPRISARQSLPSSILRTQPTPSPEISQRRTERQADAKSNPSVLILIRIVVATIFYQAAREVSFTTSACWAVIKAVAASRPRAVMR